MERYTKVVEIFGSYYMREFQKVKNHINKKREVREETVVKFFKQGQAEVLVILIEDDSKEILITPESHPDEVKRYLGKPFIY